jgi:chromosome partitioning protein
MSVLTVVSQKGGVGKTTTTLNLAFALASRGWKTLLVDTDPQGGIGLSLNRHGSSPGLAAYLSQSITLTAAVLHTRLPEFDLLPVGMIPMQDAHAFATHLADGTSLKRLTADAGAARYDLVLFDTPAGFGGITAGALRASDWALNPLQAEPAASRSFPQLLQMMASLREGGAQVRLLGVMLSMLQVRNKHSLSVAEEVWARLPNHLLFETHVPRDAAFLEASAEGLPLGLMRRRHPALAASFDQLAKEIELRLGLRIKPLEEDEPGSLFA